MPTGYTSDIYNGKDVTYKDFIMQCARAFGAAISMRDESLDAKIPEEFKLNTYYLDSLKETQDKIQEIQNMKIEEIEFDTEKEYQREVEDYKKYIAEKLELKKRYEDILEQVKGWNYPTSDHKALKEFCIQQLEESIKWDCGTSFLKEPTKSTPDEWKNNKIEKYIRDMNYYSKHWCEEVEKTKNTNMWIKKLRDSLK